MLTKINKRIKRRQGFTLVELLLVVAILAVLAFLAVPAIASTIRNSRTRTCASNEIMIEQGIWRWYADQVAAGKTLQVANANPTVFSDTTTGTVTTKALDDLGEYLFDDYTTGELEAYFTPGGVPKCPFTNANHYYILISVENSGLLDVLVYCNESEASQADGAADHPRATERERDLKQATVPPA